MRADNAELERFLNQHPRIEYVDVLLPDGCGVLRGKRVDVDTLRKIYRQGMMMPESIFGLDITGANVDDSGLIWEHGDADRICWPVPGSLQPVTWLTPPRAQLLVSMFGEDGMPFYADPRQVLARVTELFKQTGLTPVVALELEFYLLDSQRDDEGMPRPPVSTLTGERETDTQVYSMDGLYDYGAILDDIASGADDQEIPADAIVAEYAPAQFEVNLLHVPDALAAADHAVMLKRLIKGIARKHEAEATFMAKPYQAHAGNGMHVHVSLLDQAGKNAFTLEEGKNPNALLRRALGGLMETMAESVAIFAPNANSYKRFQPGSYAPLAPNWGLNNRTTALRIPAGTLDSTRIEHRLSGADANPYLVLAAVLAGILHGIKTKADPGPRATGNAYESHPPSLPSTWLAALNAFDSRKFLPHYLGDDFCKVYGACRRAEQMKFDKVVTPLEYTWYLRTV